MSDVLDAVRACLDAALPSTIATVDADGVPNVSYLSKVYYVDDDHVALTNQFFRKTSANLAVNPRAVLMVVEPGTCRQFRLAVEYDRREAEGPIFDALKNELDSIATMMGMTDIFCLSAAEIFRVTRCEVLRLSVES